MRVYRFWFGKNATNTVVALHQRELAMIPSSIFKEHYLSPFLLTIARYLAGRVKANDNGSRRCRSRYDLFLNNGREAEFWVCESGDPVLFSMKADVPMRGVRLFRSMPFGRRSCPYGAGRGGPMRHMDPVGALAEWCRPAVPPFGFQGGRWL